MQHRYFAASNSAEGFKNYYAEVFSRADFVYIIKGGPGTGKSSLMKKYARSAEERGAVCEYYYCSSDPSSLDGVLVFGERGVIGMLDGTAPHVSEPKFPGAREQIINLGECWDISLLHRQKNEIIALSERKGAEYKNAYTYLRSVGNLCAVSEGFLSEAVNFDKLRAAAGRLIRDLPCGRMEHIPAILDSVSMSGRVRLPTFEENAKKLYIISDFHGVGELFLTELFAFLRDRAVSARVSYDPICPERVDGIFLEGERVAFVSVRDAQERYEALKNSCHAGERGGENSSGGALFNGGGAALKENGGAALKENGGAALKENGGAALKENGGAALKENGGAALKENGGAACSAGEREIVFVNSKRFVDTERLREIRSELRYTERLAESSLDGALHALSKAKIYHFLLEDIYGKAMDWQKFEKICADLCEKI